MKRLLLAILEQKIQRFSREHLAETFVMCGNVVPGGDIEIQGKFALVVGSPYVFTRNPFFRWESGISHIWLSLRDISEKIATRPNPPSMRKALEQFCMIDYPGGTK